MSSARAKSGVAEAGVSEASQWKKPRRGKCRKSRASRSAAAALKAASYWAASSGCAAVWRASSAGRMKMLELQDRLSATLRTEAQDTDRAFVTRRTRYG